MIIAISGKMGSGKDTVANMLQYHLSDNPGNEGTFKQYNYLYNERSTGVHQPEWEIKRFGDKIKEIVCLLIGCTREELEDREFKEKPLGEEWDKWRISWEDTIGIRHEKIFSDFHEAHNFKDSQSIVDPTANAELIKMTPRKLMQLLGTDCGRDIIHPNIWVNALFADYTHHMETVPGYSLNAGEPHMVEDYWIISDMRFPNELNRVQELFGTTIRVERPTEERFPELWDHFQESDHQEWERFLKAWRGAEYDKIYHPSETSLDNVMDWNCIIENTESLEHLFTETKLIAENL